MDNLGILSRILVGGVDDDVGGLLLFLLLLLLFFVVLVGVGFFVLIDVVCVEVGRFLFCVWVVMRVSFV